MGKQRPFINRQVAAGITVVFLSLPCWGASSGPDCSGIQRWPTQTTKVRLAEFGFTADQLDDTKTKTELVATMPVKGKAGTDTVYQQVYRIHFLTNSGEPVNVMTTTLANDEECSAGLVSIALIAKELSH